MNSTTPSSADLNALLRRITVIGDHADRHRLSETLARAQAPVSVGFINQHGLNLCCADAGFRLGLLDCDVLLRDGAGMKIALRLFGLEPGLNMNGTDYIPELLAALRRHRRDCSLHLYGTQQPWLDLAGRRLAAEHSLPTVTRDGFLPGESYVEAALADPAAFKLIVLGMGMPKQEQVARTLKNALDGPALIICGGAILDFLAGRVPRAPRWMQRAGLEWAYRLLQEPRRLFRRYVIGIPYFFARICSARLRTST